jgi:hypothetical protein
MMRLFLVLILFCGFSHAEVWEISLGKSTYEVKHLVKKVHSESRELKGKMECGEKECEFLVAVAVKSYTSNDSNRDLNMQTTTEASKYPMALARGTFPADGLSKTEVWMLPLEVEFHGKKMKYQAKVSKKADGRFTTDFILKLDQHGIERPSLFSFKIEDEVPMHFELTWIKKI